jgi:hypothetical protein
MQKLSVASPTCHVVDQLTQRGDPWGLNEEAEHVPPYST